MGRDQGASANADRATRPTAQAPAGLGDTASVPCAWTPGPWRIHTYNGGHLLGYIQGAPVDGARYGDAVVLKLAKPTSARSHANARLIAAAPEMYQLAEQFERVAEYELRKMEREKPEDDEGIRLRSLNLNIIRGTLAKARGGL